VLLIARELLGGCWSVYVRFKKTANKHDPKQKTDMHKYANKSKGRFGILCAVGISLLASTAWATPGVPTVPDGGSSALLITAAVSALALARRLFR